MSFEVGRLLVEGMVVLFGKGFEGVEGPVGLEGVDGGVESVEI